MSEGFHPKPRMSFPSALALGIEGLDEVMELELAESCTADELLARLARHAVPGLSFPRVEMLPAGTKKARVRSSTYELSIPVARQRDAALRVERLLGKLADSAGEGPDAALLRRSLEEIGLREGVLRFRLRARRERSAGPRDVLAATGLDDLEPQGVYLTRSGVELEP